MGKKYTHKHAVGYEAPADIEKGEIFIQVTSGAPKLHFMGENNEKHFVESARWLKDIGFPNRLTTSIFGAKTGLSVFDNIAGLPNKHYSCKLLFTGTNSTDEWNFELGGGLETIVLLESSSGNMITKYVMEVELMYLGTGLWVVKKTSAVTTSSGTIQSVSIDKHQLGTNPFINTPGSSGTHAYAVDRLQTGRLLLE